MLQGEFSDVFSPLISCTKLIEHHTETTGVVVHNHTYCLPEHKKKVVQEEVMAMLDMEVIKETQWLEQPCGFDAQR